MNRDFVAMLAALSDAEADYLQDVPTIGKNDFIRNKRAVARPRDLADVAEIEAQAQANGSQPIRRTP
jgi:hypothetical protein